MKVELTLWEKYVVVMLRKSSHERVAEIIKAAFPGYTIRKIRKDAGIRRGESINDEK